MKMLPPRAEKIPKVFIEHGEEREDPYFWMKDKENPKVEAYVREENTYYASVMDKLADLKAGYFEKLKSRMAPEAVEVPYSHGPYLYSSVIPEGHEYGIYSRRKPGGPLETILDLGELAKKHSYLDPGAYEVSDLHDCLAYSLDTEGDEIYRIYFKNLANALGSPPETIDGTDGDVVFSTGGDLLYYVRLNEQHRPFQVWRHRINTAAGTDFLVYEESDPRFFLSVHKSSDGEWIFVNLSSAESTEVLFGRRDEEVDAFQVFSPRADRHEYQVDAQAGRFLILSNHEEVNFGLYETPVELATGLSGSGTDDWAPILVGDANVDLREFVSFKDSVALLYASKGIESVRIYSGRSNRFFDLEFPEVIRQVSFLNNEEFSASVVRIAYSSPVTPTQTVEFDLTTGMKTVLYQLVAPGFRPEEYVVERTEVTAPDGVKIPVSLMFKSADRGKPLPTLLYGYGSYGMVTPTGFSIYRSVIVDAGFIYAIAHVRGSGDLGQRWYREGKFLKKKNTFADFLAVAKALVTSGRSLPGEITIHGGSAGGMLVGATLNLDAKLFRGAIAEVPFVDVLNTMLDESLPLTPTEWDEWGDPRKPEYYRAMREYSPYDRLERGEYPYVLVNGGWNDPRVTYWEPTKYVAKLRELRTDDRLTILDIEMGAGHFGVTGRFSALEKPAEVLAFIHAIHFERHRLIP